MLMSIMSDPPRLSYFIKNARIILMKRLPSLQFFFSSISSSMVKHGKKMLKTFSSPNDEDHILTKTRAHFVITQFLGLL